MKTTILDKTTKVEKQRDFPILVSWRKAKEHFILIKDNNGKYSSVSLSGLKHANSSRLGKDFLEMWVLYSEQIKNPCIKVISKKIYEGEQVYPCFKTDEKGLILCLFINENDGILLSIFGMTQFSFIAGLACDNTYKSFGPMYTLNNPVIEIYGEETSFI